LRLFAFAAFASHPEDILVITHQTIIDEMQLYEAAIQEAIESSKWIYCYFWNCTYKPETGYGYY
jgi:mannose-1-phosphate guanylyltransferase